MDRNMKDGGKIIKNLVKEDVSIKTVMFMKACGNLIRESMDKESIHFQTAEIISVKCKTIFSKALVKKPGLMVILMKEITMMGPNMEEEYKNGLIERNMMETGYKT